MAQFQILLEDGRKLLYESEASTLVDMATNRLLDISTVGKTYRQVSRLPHPGFSPEEPLIGKSRHPRRLKIQLGLGCNYACSYCSQGNQRGLEEATLVDDIDPFLESLARAEIDASQLEKVEFWGGEPLVYWAKLQALIPKVRSKIPSTTKLLIITNGSLLDREKIDFLSDNAVEVVVSHDGPGQHLRGPDPFENAEWCEIALYAAYKLQERFSFNAVMTPESYDPENIRLFFASRVPGVKVNIEDPVAAYEGMHGFTFSDAQLEEMHNRVFDFILGGNGLKMRSMLSRVDEFVNSLAYVRELESLGMGCGMDRRDYLAVDLHGNVLTCQNTAANGGHKIGNVSALDDVSLNTSKHWSKRKDCRECPVVQLCQGSCMFLSGHHFTQSCRNSYHFYTAIMKAAISLVAGSRVKEIIGSKPSFSTDDAMPKAQPITFIKRKVKPEIVTGQYVAEWVAKRFGFPLDYFGQCHAIGIKRNGALSAGVVFNRENKNHVHCHMISDGSKRWATREFLRAMAEFPFVTLNKRRVTAIVEPSNEASLKFLEHYGFTLEHVMRFAGEVDDSLILRLFKEDCRWLTKESDHAQ